MREKVIEEYLRKKCKENGFLCYKFTSPSTDGVPDRIVIGHGLTLFVELKAPGEVPRKLQVFVFDEMEKHGAEIHVVDTKDKVNALIAELLERKKF